MPEIEAIVVDNQDPELRGRLKVRCEMLFGGGTAIEDWVEPLFPFAGAGHGWFFIPQKKAIVVISYDDAPEDLGFSGISLSRPNFRWKACLYASIDDVPDDFGKAAKAGGKYGEVHGIASPGGQIFKLDDRLREMIFKFGKLRLGSDTSGNALVLGDLIQGILSTTVQHVVDALTTIEAAYDLHAHGAPGTIPTVPLTPALTPSITSLTADKGQIDGPTWLSSIAFTQKEAP